VEDVEKNCRPRGKCRESLLVYRHVEDVDDFIPRDTCAIFFRKFMMYGTGLIGLVKIW